MTESPIKELEFLSKLQRLIDEGDFTSTYKFALLNALADLSVEKKLEPALLFHSTPPSIDVGRLANAADGFLSRLVNCYMLYPARFPLRS